MYGFCSMFGSLCPPFLDSVQDLEQKHFWESVCNASTICGKYFIGKLKIFQSHGMNMLGYTMFK